MECGGDTFCELVGILLENGFIAGEIAEILNSTWSDSIKSAHPVVTFLQNYFVNIFSIAIGSYGIWRGWRYRESILHKRFLEYLQEQDSRLDHARNDLITAIQQPLPGRLYQDPIFCDTRLRSVLRERRWDFATFGKVVVRSVNGELNDSLKFIANRIETAEGMLQSFRKQRAAAHLLKGAVAAAEAPNTLTTNDSVKLDRQALQEFRIALQVPGHTQDLQTKEYEAHQLRKLGLLDDAEHAYKQLEDWSRNTNDEKVRTLLVARSKMYRASILQTRALLAFYRDRIGRNGGAATANNLLGEAEELRAKYAPYHAWELIEQTHLHYIRAIVYDRLQFTVQRAAQLELASLSASTLISETPSISPLKNQHYRRLRRAAMKTQDLVQSAVKSGKFDYDWLLPPIDGIPPSKLESTSNNPQQPTEPVGAASGDQGIQEAPKQGGIDDPGKS